LLNLLYIPRKQQQRNKSLPISSAYYGGAAKLQHNSKNSENNKYYFGECEQEEINCFGLEAKVDNQQQKQLQHINKFAADGLNLNRNFDCNDALFSRNYNVVGGGVNEDLECDVDAYFAYEADGFKDDDFAGEFEDKNKRESLFTKNFLTAENNLNNFINNNYKDSKQRDSSSLRVSPCSRKKAFGEEQQQSNDKYHGFLLSQVSQSRPDYSVSPFVHNLNNANNNKIQIEPKRENPNFTLNNKNVFEQAFNQTKKKQNNYNKTNQNNQRRLISTEKLANQSKYILKITSSVVYDIVKYLVPKELVFIEDNSTIYGTYIKIKPFSVDNLISNIYLIYSCLNVYNSVNNFTFENALQILLNNEKDFKKIATELFGDFTADNAALKDKDPNNKYPLSINQYNQLQYQEKTDLAIKFGEESSGFVLKECNAENYLFYNVQNLNLLESLRRKYLFEKSEEEELNYIKNERFSDHNNSIKSNLNLNSINNNNNNNQAAKYNCSRLSGYNDHNHNPNNYESISRSLSRRQVNDGFFIRAEESILSKNHFNKNIDNNNKKKNNYNSFLDYNNNNNQNASGSINNLASSNPSYYCCNSNAEINNNKINDNTKNLLISNQIGSSELEQNFYSRQNTDFALEYLKDKFNNLNLKEPKAAQQKRIYTNDFNFGKCLEHVVINNNEIDKLAAAAQAELSFNNNFSYYNDFEAKGNCLVSAYMRKNRKHSERLNNRSLEKELFLLFVNKKKIDFLLKNFPNEAFNPYNPYSTILFELNSAKSSAYDFSLIPSKTCLNSARNAFNLNYHNSLQAAVGKKICCKASNSSYSVNNINNCSNQNSYTNQKQQQGVLFDSNSSSLVNHCNISNNNSNHIINNNNVCSDSFHVNKETFTQNNVNNLTSNSCLTSKTAAALACSTNPAFNRSSYISPEFLCFFLENSQNLYRNRSFSSRFFKENLTFLQSHSASLPPGTKTTTASDLFKAFKDNNFILRSESVFLNSAKSGFIVSKIGCFEEVMKAIKIEFQEFSNAETQSGKIEFISFDKFFEFQKLDLNSREYKGEIDKNSLFNSQGIFQKSFFCHNKNNKNENSNFSADIKSEFSFLYLIETSGDPCGIMNRQREVVFAVSKRKKIENNKLFAFTNRAGFLLGNEINCSVYHRDWEAQAFLAYEPLFDKWSVSDLTCYLKPSAFYSKDYHGLWMCVSPDKRSVNRFSSIQYAVKSGDEIKISETVISVGFDYRC